MTEMGQLGRKRVEKYGAFQHFCTWQKFQKIPVTLAHAKISQHISLVYDLGTFQGTTLHWSSE